MLPNGIEITILQKLVGHEADHESAHFEHHRNMRSLKLTIGYNASDGTFGWKGAHGSLTIYYTKRIPSARELTTVIVDYTVKFCDVKNVLNRDYFHQQKPKT